MLTEAEIVNINQNTGIIKVRIPLFETIGSNQAVILEASLATPEGIYSNYKVGDLVFVGFERNKAELPIILGKIYKGLTDSQKDTGGNLTCQDLVASRSAKIPSNTTITGDNVGFSSFSSLLHTVFTLNQALNKKTYCCSFNGKAYYTNTKFINITFKLTTNNQYTTPESFISKFTDTGIGFILDTNGVAKTLPVSSLYINSDSNFQDFISTANTGAKTTSDIQAIGLFHDPKIDNLHKLFIRLLINNTVAVNYELKVDSLNYCIDMTNI